MIGEPATSRPIPAPPPEGGLLRAGAVSIVLGGLLGLTASAFHGGTPPEDLAAVLPQVAANDAWELVHLAQFVADVLSLVGWFALYRSLIVSTDGASTTLARLAILVAVAAEGVYGANQAVDIANKFVAQQWVGAPDAEKATAFRIAEAVRHIEIGTSSVWVLSAGIAMLLFGLAISLGRAYPRPLGWAAIALGAIQAAQAVELARHGFAASPLALAGLLSVPWSVALAILLWGKGGRSGQRVRPRL
jgi:hypothetical protein